MGGRGGGGGGSWADLAGVNARWLISTVTGQSVRQNSSLDVSFYLQKQ